ncbi:MAG: T9SS type A sorting domain-containing protein [Bacteroidales bacterium]|nr:T9SS type A sorting domain-containing protein [Bacteroidales bacterium]
MNKQSFIIFLMLTLFGSFSFSQTITKTIKFDIPEIISEDDGFSSILYKDSKNFENEGKPNIPHFGVSMLLTQGHEIANVKIVSQTYYPGVDGRSIKAASRQFPLSNIPDKDDYKVIPNNEIYSSNIAYPVNAIENISTHFLAGHSIGSFSICPISFIPKAKHIDFTKEIVLEITLKSTSRATNAQQLLRNSTLIENRIKNIVDNPEKLSDYSYDASKDNSQMDILLITQNSFVDSFEPYLEFKQSTGFICGIKCVEEIYSEYTGQDDQEKIRNCIIDYYENYGISYVILGGDGDNDGLGQKIIPHRGFYGFEGLEDEYDIPADMYYSNLDGNWNTDNDGRWGEVNEADLYAELGIGRICADNISKVENHINKLQLYQNAPVIDDIEKALFLGELLFVWNDSIWGGDYKDEVAYGSSNNGFTTIGLSDNISCNRFYEREKNWEKQEVFDEVSNYGVNLRNHLGGSYLNYNLKMYNSDLTSSNFQNNGTNRGFMVSYSQGSYCGAFDNRGFSGYQGDCFAETITCIETADVATIGNSRDGWADISGTNGSSQYFDRQFFDAIFGEDITAIGIANADSKEDNVPFLDDYIMRWCFYELNLFGDPSMDIWTAVPTDIIAQYPESIPLGTIQVEVQTDVPFARIALFQDEVLKGRTVAIESGEAIIDLFSPIISQSTVSISIIGHNKNRLQDNIEVTSDTPYIVFDSNEINDINCNGNGLLDYGENVFLSLGLFNVGNQAGSGVTATISSENPYITITDNTEYYGDFDPQEVSFINNAYAFFVSADVPDGEAILFKVTAESGETIWETYFSIIAHAPILNFVDFEILGNGKIDVGETTEISISITNAGSADAYNVITELISESPYITINSEPQSLGTISPDNLVETVFNITASENTPPGRIFELIVDISDYLGITSSSEFTVLVGQIPVFILDYDGNNTSAPVIRDALFEFGMNCESDTLMPPDLNKYSAVFVCLGMSFVNNHILTSAQGSILAEYLNNGGNIYMEGGDTWYYDPQTAVHPMFNIDPEADGNGDIVKVLGKNGTFTQGMSFDYIGDNSYVDHIDAISPAVLIFKNPNPDYGMAVAYDAGDYKTIGASFEFGGLVDGVSTKLELISKYIDFFGFWDFNTQTQNIDLNAGYQFVSSRIETENPDMLIVFQDILNENLDFVRNSNSQSLKKIGPVWVNGIGDWITTEGYLIKMSDDETLTLSGDEVNPLSPINLSMGYQFVSFLPENPIDALIAFSGILTNDLDYIRNSNGETIRKIGITWVNGIGNAKPDEAYLIKMFADDQLIYTIPTKTTKSATPAKVMNHFVFEGGNAADPVYSIYIGGLNIGNEVAVFDGEKMVGANVIVSENVLENSVPIFSTLSNRKGFEANSPISLIVWDSQKQIEVPATYTFDNEYSNYYTKNVFPENDGELSVINITKESSAMMENAAIEVNIYPNPATEVLNIVSDNTIKKIRIMNLIGQTMFDSEINRNKTVICTSAYKTGIYILRIETSYDLAIQKIMIK